MLFRRKQPKACKHCKHCTLIDDSLVLCIKRGIVSADGSCRKFHYDPCKRIPLKAKAPDFQKYTQSDFDL